MGKRMSATTNETELRGSATKNGQAPVIEDAIEVLSPEQVQSQTRTQMLSASKAIADPLTSPLARMVHDQLAYNVLQKLPTIMEEAGSTLRDFMSGALSNDNLTGANLMTPYLKKAGIED